MSPTDAIVESTSERNDGRSPRPARPGGSCFQGFDHDYLVAASAELGPNVAGVANVPADISDREVEDLACAGVRAIRFNLYRGGSGAGDDLLRLALRVASIADMHTEVYVDAVDPHALMFGTDLPSTRARRPFDAGDVALIEESLGKEALPEGLRVNARAFYRMRPG